MSSIVRETLKAISLDKIPDRIDLYNQLVDAAEPMFQITGKHLEVVCKEHANNLMVYDLLLQECRTIEDTIRVKIEEIESNLYQKYQGGPRALSSTDIKNYIKGDKQYVTAYEILLEVVHTKRRLEAVVEALKSLGWSVNNIVKLRIALLEDTVL